MGMDSGRNCVLGGASYTAMGRGSFSCDVERCLLLCGLLSDFIDCLLIFLYRISSLSVLCLAAQ